MRVLAIGRTQFLYETIEKLRQSGHEIAGVLTGQAQPEYARKEEDFRRLAGEIGVAFRLDERINSEAAQNWIRACAADVAVSVNWRTRIGRETIDLLPHGVLNAHAGDLPRYRGNATVAWAILNGEREITLTIHKMDEGLDSGDIVLQHRLPIAEDTYITQLYKAYETLVPDLFAQAVDGLASGRITPRPQPTDPALSLRCYPRLPRDGRIDWREQAVLLHRLVRASAEPYEGAYTFLDGRRLTIWRAKLERPPFPFLGTPGQVAEIRPETGEAAVAANGGFLVLQEVETEQNGRVAAASAIVSIRARLG